MVDDNSEDIVGKCEAIILQVAWLTDHGPHTEIPSLFTEDGEVDRDGALTRGRAALTEMYAKRPASLLTRHVISNIMVQVGSPQEATSTSYATVFRYRSQDSSPPKPPVTCAGAESVMENYDRFVLTQHGWRLARRALRTIIQAPGAK